MYCPNCGKKVKEESDFCLNCGKMLKETITPHKNINGLSVAGLTIAAISSLIIFSCMGTPLEIKEEILYSKGTYEFVLSAVSNIFFYLILPIISLILSISGYKHNKNVIGLTGIIISIIALLGVTLITFYIFSLT